MTCALVASACGGTLTTDLPVGIAPSGDPAEFRWHLPAGFPTPIVPADNPMNDAKVLLGRRLFFDPRLSNDGAVSCATCHKPSKAFADGRNLPLGSGGRLHPRNSMALSNVAFQQTLGWADPKTTSLEAQVRIPLLGDAPLELGMGGHEVRVLQRLYDVPLYRALFVVAFATDTAQISVNNVARAIAAFERTLISGNSPYDRFRRGDTHALPKDAQRGATLFASDRLQCARCHSGVLFTNAVRMGGVSPIAPQFANTGLYNVGGNGAYAAPNTGLFASTGVLSDMGRFKIPSLRNVAVTYPYMHDGSVATLEDVIDHYAGGGRTLTAGPAPGIGRRNPYKHAFVAGFRISPSEKLDLLAFLRSLTDSTFLTDSTHMNPWVTR